MKFRGVTATVIIALALGLSPQAARANDWSPLRGVVITVPAVYDQQAGAAATGLDLNLIFLFLNGGVSYRHWGSSDNGVRGWDGSVLSDDETTLYLGLGLVNMLEVQAGFSDSGTSMRVRSDLVLFQDKFPLLPSVYGRDCDTASAYSKCNGLDLFRRGLVVSPFLEFTPSGDNHKTLYGIGIGIVF